MSYEQLCEAALTRSDNTAGNLLLRRLGGPDAVTTLARSVGDDTTRLDRWEPDWTTPRAATSATRRPRPGWRVDTGS